MDNLIERRADKHIDNTIRTVQDRVGDWFKKECENINAISYIETEVKAKLSLVKVSLSPTNYVYIEVLTINDDERDAYPINVEGTTVITNKHFREIANANNKGGGGDDNHERGGDDKNERGCDDNNERGGDDNNEREGDDNNERGGHFSAGGGSDNEAIENKK